MFRGDLKVAQFRHPRQSVLRKAAVYAKLGKSDLEGTVTNPASDTSEAQAGGAGNPWCLRLWNLLFSDGAPGSLDYHEPS